MTLSNQNDAPLGVDGQVAIVCGGGSGIGAAATRLLAGRGARVLLADRVLQPAEQLARQLRDEGLTVEAVELDLTDSNSCAAVVANAMDRWASLDILVNCAGIAGGNTPVAEMTDEMWHRVVDVNLTGTFKICRAAVPVMIERGYGRIVLVSSVAGKEGNPNAAHYSSAKAGVIAFTRSLGKEVASHGVLVNALTPAVIDTPMIHDVTPAQLDYMVQRIPLGRMGKPEEVARLIGFLASPEVSFSTAAVFDISGGRSTY